MTPEHAARPGSSERAGTRRHRRQRRWAAVGAVAVLAVGASTLATPDRAAVADDTTVTLSATVLPGQPVPMDIVRARTVAEFGERAGAGVDVAIIDSGISPVRGLDQRGKVLHGPDLSDEGHLANLAHLDTYGHGTHLAGIIAGDDGAQVRGMAPASRLVSVKVAGANGATDVAQVIAAIEWVVQHRNDHGMNIRVLNLALGLPTSGSHVGDPLAAAVERAWQAGIVVVVAAGNRGNRAGSIDSPAISPYVVATGGLESFSAWGVGDTVGPWSSGGNGKRDPDVVAAGRSIQSFRVPGSYLDQAHPTARVGERYFRGTGTSQSAAVTSGLVAAMLSEHPRLTPDQVKFLLTSEASDLLPGLVIDGHGSLNPKMITKRVGQAWKAPQQSFVSAWAGLDAGPELFGASWSGGTWSGASWSGGSWSGASWSGASWSGASWSGGEWSGASWSGASWSGGDWSGASWSGASWSGASWSGASWSGASWSSELWR